MNFFYLDEDPWTSIEYHCDKHIVKMPTEYKQMLCTAHRVLDGDERANELFMYKKAHVNHPSTIWVRDNVHNYWWLYRLFTALCDEYTYRYGKGHMTDLKLRDTLRKPPMNIPVNKKFYQPPQCMPDQYKGEDSVEAYQKYYMGEKSSFSVWKKRPTPTWYIV